MDPSSSTRQVDDSNALDLAIRAGLVAYGVVSLLIGWLALQLALGDKEGNASSSGALQQLAEQPFGQVMLWLVAVGMFLLVVWRVLEAIRGEDDDDGASEAGKRAVHVGKAVLYGFIGFTAAQTAMGSGSGGGGGTDGITATVMNWTGGQFLVGAVGLGIMGYGAYQVYYAYSDKFREKIDAEGKSGNTGTAYVVFGKVGYTAKGVSLLVVGGLFAYAAATHDAQKSGGLDQALLEVLQAPLGPFLVGAIAVGIMCYGLFCFARARHLSR